MSELITHISSADASPSNEWVQVVRHFNETGSFDVRDIYAVLGNPVGGVVGAALPNVETTYRHASGG